MHAFYLCIKAADWSQCSPRHACLKATGPLEKLGELTLFFFFFVLITPKTALETCRFKLDADVADVWTCFFQICWE